MQARQQANNQVTGSAAAVEFYSARAVSIGHYSVQKMPMMLVKFELPSNSGSNAAEAATGQLFLQSADALVRVQVIQTAIAHAKQITT